MKKLLLISALILTGSCVVIAQSQLGVKSTVGYKGYPILKNIPTNEAIFPSAAVPINSKSHKTPSTLGSRVVGYTCYELQSNCAAPRNIINHGDGSFSFAWTIDDACAVNNVNRGTGYNYWNGTTLAVPGGATARLEPVRTGFSQIAVLGTGGTAQEVVFAHNGPPYDFQMSTNGAIGSTTWTSANAGATTPLPVSTTTSVTSGLWARIATGGTTNNTIHLINGYFDGKDKGILTPNTYSRSTDGGASWSEQSVMMPGYDSTRVLSGSGEAYSIDAEGSTVAILYGGFGQDIALWKSTDDGATFTRTFVDSSYFAPSFDSIAAPGDTALTSDGAVSVVVAPNGTAHVAYSTTIFFKDTAGTTYFSPGYVGLIYWNDNAKTLVPIQITTNDIDTSANGGNDTDAWEVAQYTANINANAAPSPPSARYGNRAFLTIPSIAVDGNNVFIVFSLVTDGDSTVDQQSYRDIWVVASQDGGVTFGPIQNVTCTQGEEEFFSSLAKKVDNNLHILYDLDTEPGTNIQNGDPIAASEIRYATIDKAKVLAGTASCSTAGLGVVEHGNSVFNVADNYPNPTSGLTYFDVTMKKSAAISMEIFNNIGQQVYVSSEKLSVGKHTLSVDASTFSAGLYFYTIKSGDAIVSGKMTVVAE